MNCKKLFNPFSGHFDFVSNSETPEQHTHTTADVQGLDTKLENIEANINMLADIETPEYEFAVGNKTNPKCTESKNTTTYINLIERNPRRNIVDLIDTRGRVKITGKNGIDISSVDNSLSIDAKELKEELMDKATINYADSLLGTALDTLQPKITQNATQLANHESRISTLENDTPEAPIFVVPILYNELKLLRDNAQLTAGVWYRITDYECTTLQENTTAANHHFDILVLALTNNKLSENARATHHDGDSYFANSNLQAWELKYCIDNDQNRFKWANPENGKGVIYYMKDEFDNEAPYDFKNIMFNIAKEGEPDKYVYTFWYEDDDVICDRSMPKKFGSSISVYNTAFCNCIKPYFEQIVDEDNPRLQVQKLNFITLGTDFIDFGREMCRNFFDYNCHNITLLGNQNRFGKNCFDIHGELNLSTIGDSCEDINAQSGTQIKIGNYCQNIQLGIDINHVNIGDNCYQILFGNNYTNITIGNNCAFIDFENLDYVASFAIENNVQFIRITDSSESGEPSSDNLLNYIVVQHFFNNFPNSIYKNLLCHRNNEVVTEFKEETVVGTTN